MDQFPTLSHDSAVQALMLAQWKEWQRHGMACQGKRRGCSTVRRAVLAPVFVSTSFAQLKWWPVFPHGFHTVLGLLWYWQWHLLLALHSTYMNELRRKCSAMWAISSSEGPASCSLETLTNKGVAESRSKKPPQKRFRKAIDFFLFVGSIQSQEVPGVIVQFLFCLGFFWLGSLFHLFVCEGINFNRYSEYQTTSGCRLVFMWWKSH